MRCMELELDTVEDAVGMGGDLVELMAKVTPASGREERAPWRRDAEDAAALAYLEDGVFVGRMLG